MANQIRLKRASGSNPSASDLVTGELAVRTDTGKLFTKKDDNSVAEIGATVGSDAVDTAAIQDDAVTTAKVAAGNITETELASNAVTGAKIATGAINNANKIQDSIITGAKIGSGTVVAGNIASNAVTSAKIADDAVTAAKVASNAVVNASVDASAAIAGTKISPDFGSQNVVTTGTLGSGDISITGSQPALNFIDSGDNPDYILYNNNGALRLHDSTNSADRFVVNTDGHVDVTGNLDVGAGVDVTGNISVSGTVDGRDVATDGTKLDGIESGATADQSASEILTLIKTVDGAGSGLDADTLDGISSASFVRSDASDTMAGVYTFSQAANEKIILSGSDDPLIRFQEGTTDKAFIQWNSAGFLRLMNQEDDSVLRIKDDIEFSQNNSTYHKVFHAGNDGSGSGLDADLLDGEEGSFYRNASNINAGTLAAARVATLNQDTTGTAAIATTVTCTDESSDTTCAVLFATGFTGNNPVKTGSNLAFNSSSGVLTATGFAGALTGNVTGNASGSSGSCTGNAATATALETARTIAGVSFDGSANISLNNNAITNGAGYITATLTNEQVQDIVGAMVSGNTESGISVTYQDSDGTLDFSVSSQTDNNFTTTLKNKLDGIAASATNVTNNNQLTNGAGYITSADGGNAATLDSIDSSQFLRSDTADTANGVLTISGGVSFGANAKCPAAISSLSDGSTITVDFTSGIHHTVTLGGNRTFGDPNNTSAATGQSGSIFIVQDGTGSRTASFHADYSFAGGTAPTLSTAANAVDRLDYVVRGVNDIHCVVTLDVK